MTEGAATLTVGASTGTVSGTVTGTVGLHVPGFDVTGTLAVNVTSTSVTVSGTGVTVKAGGLSLHADVLFSSTTDASGARTVSVSLTNSDGATSLFLDVPNAFSVQDGSGILLVTPTGTSGSLTLTSPVFHLPAGVSLTGNLVLTFGGGSASVRVTGGSLTLPGAHTLSGNFAFDRTADGVTRVAFTDVSLTVGSASLTQGEGGFVILAGGVAGYLSGVVAAGTSGASASGQMLVRVNTSAGAVSQSVELGGRTVDITFATGNVFEASLSDLTIDIGGFVTIEGNVTFTSTTLPNGQTASVFAGNGLRIFIGRGPAVLGTGGTNPLATGVLLTDATIGLVRTGSGATAGYALVAGGTVRLIGVQGVTLAGTAAVRVNTTGLAVDQSIAIPGSTADPIAVVFASAARVTRFEVTGMTLSLMGQSISGDLLVDKTDTGDVVLGLANVSLSLGGAVSLTDGHGVVVLERPEPRARSPATSW